MLSGKKLRMMLSGVTRKYWRGETGRLLRRTRRLHEQLSTCTAGGPQRIEEPGREGRAGEGVLTCQSLWWLRGR